MAKNKKYTVAGPHKVHGAAKGESVTLDPSKPGTVRLLARGQITVPVPSQQNSDETPTEDDSPAATSEESEE